MISFQEKHNDFSNNKILELLKACTQPKALAIGPKSKPTVQLVNLVRIVESRTSDAKSAIRYDDTL